MAFLEAPTYCSLVEYDSGICKRLDESDIQPETLFTYMVRLDSRAYPAASFPVKAQDIVRRSGIVVVNFVFLDKDLNTTYIDRQVVSNGIVHSEDDTLVIESPENEEHEVIEGYLKDYFEDGFGLLLKQSDSLVSTR